MKILVSAAKTGGHVFPAIAIGDELIKRGHQVIFLGSGAEIEKNALKDKKFSYYQISMKGFRGKSILNKISTLFLIPLSILKTIQILRKERIDAMIGFGGFITLPPAFAFLIMGKPIFTHEQNSVIGSANKVLSKFSKINFIAFPTISNIKNTFCFIWLHTVFFMIFTLLELIKKVKKKTQPTTKLIMRETRIQS